MLLTDHLPALVLTAIAGVLLRRLFTTVFRYSKEPEVWRTLEAVGILNRGLFPWARAIAASVISTQEYVTEGYNRFSKTLHQPFALPTTWTDKAIVVLPPSMLHHMLTRPDKLPDSEIGNIPGLIDAIQLPYIISDPEIYLNALHFDVVRRKMSKKDMHFFAAMTAEEIDLGFGEIWGTSKEWTTINAWDMCGRIIARATERMIIGLPLGRDEELLKVSRLYANSVLLGGAIMNCFPPWARRFVAPIIALRAKYYQIRCRRILVPVIDQRLKIWSEGTNGDNVPDDFLQWLIDTCAKDGAHQLNSPRIANRVVALMTPLIFAVCYVFAHAVLDLYSSPDKETFLSGIEAECRHVSVTHNGLSTPEAADALYRVDSTIRESMRVSDVSVTGLHRDVTSGDLDIGNGIRIPSGVRMGFPTQNIHLDPSNYDDPLCFDAFRFSRKFEGMEEMSPQRKVGERELITTLTPSFLALGYGRHGCPGRWFAAQTMKQALAYIVMNYDIKLIGKPIKRKSLLNTMVPPVDAQMRIRRKR